MNKFLLSSLIVFSISSLSCADVDYIKVAKTKEEKERVLGNLNSMGDMREMAKFVFWGDLHTMQKYLRSGLAELGKPILVDLDYQFSHENQLGVWGVFRYEGCTRTLLMIAAENRLSLNIVQDETFINAAKTIEWLLSIGADANVQEKAYGDTALILAIDNGQNQNVKALLKDPTKINLELANKNGNKAIHFAVLRNNVEAFIDLLNAGAQIDQRLLDLLYSRKETSAEIKKAFNDLYMKAYDNLKS